jgi:predicted O-methyltransferase YrrM
MHAGLPMENKIYFSEENTDSFFLRLSKQLSKPYFDVIFIDADHSYEGVRKDFVNAQKHINEGGLIIFHDIASQACPGIMRILKRNHQTGVSNLFTQTPAESGL